MRLEDALNQRASGVILLVCALVELVRGTTSTGGALLLLHVTKDVLLCHVLLSGGLRGALEALGLLRYGLERFLGCLPEGLAFHGFDLALLHFDRVLVLAEVCPVQGLQLG